jgi:hypothetical protein
MNSARNGAAISRHLPLFRRVRGREPCDPTEKSDIWRKLATPFRSIRVHRMLHTPCRLAGGHGVAGGSIMVRVNRASRTAVGGSLTPLNRPCLPRACTR